MPRCSADSSAAGAGRVFHNDIPPSKQNHLGTPRNGAGWPPFTEYVVVLGLVGGPFREREREPLIEPTPR